MPTNLTGATIASTYDQLLHVDDGPTATEKTVHSGTGVATALKVGTTSASVGNVQLIGNTIQAITGSLTLGASITFGSASNARTALGLGTMATQNSGAVAITGGTISGVTFSGSFSGLTLVESTTLATSNAAAGCNLNGTTLAADGTDTNINLNIMGKGTGSVLITKAGIVSGSINNTTLGAGSPSTVVATTIEAVTSIGYAGGSGGTVTQATSRTTGVTLNKITGEIVLFATTISGHDADEFTLTNSTIEANDVLILCIKSGCAAGTRKFYQVHVVAVSAGSCVISVGNIDNATVPSTGTDAPVIQFVVLKGVIT